MEHEELPGNSEGEYITWWEIAIETISIITGIVFGSILLVGVGLYLAFSSIVLKEGVFKDE